MTEAAKRKLRDRMDAFRAQGLCIACGRPAVPGKLRCQWHLDYLRFRMREKRREWVRQGRCSRCGRLAEGGSSRCARCKEDRRRRKARSPSPCRTHHTSLPCNEAKARKFSDDWNQVTCERCLTFTGREL